MTSTTTDYPTHSPVTTQRLLGHADSGVSVLQQTQFALLAVERSAQIGSGIMNPLLVIGQLGLCRLLSGAHVLRANRKRWNRLIYVGVNGMRVHK